MIHFISGLPRSGSTLLAGILSQNKNIRAGISSPLLPSVKALINEWSKPEAACQWDESERDRILSFLVNQSPGAWSAQIVDTNRGWTAHMPLIHRLSAQSRVICCVRNLGWIVNSVERAISRWPLRASTLFSGRCDGNVYDHARQMMDETKGMVGRAYASLKQAWFGPYSEKLIVVPYDCLVRSPRLAIAELYELCNWPRYNHDFDTVEFSSPKFDEVLGCPGLHTIEGPVRQGNPPLIIPPDLFDSYSDSEFWLNPDMNFKGVRVLAPPRAQAA